MKTAAIYCRVSTEDQEKEGTSLQTQLEACLKYCQDKGYDPVYRFSEAYSGLTLERPKLNELRELVRASDIDVIVCYCLDRLSRDPVHGVILTEELEKHMVALEAVTESVDGSDLGKLITYVRGYAAKLEAIKIRERTMRGKLARAQRGLIPSGGSGKLYGYRYCDEKSADVKKGVRVEDEAESQWVKKIFAWYTQDRLTLDEITLKLRGLGVPTPRGKGIWYHNTIRRILTNSSYIGKTFVNTEKVEKDVVVALPQDKWIELPGATPAIIDEATFEAAQSALRRNKELAKRNGKNDFLLGERVRCARCGRPYWGRSKHRADGTTWRGYTCSGNARIVTDHYCGNTTHNAAKLEGLVWAEIEKIISDPEVVMAEVQRTKQEANGAPLLKQSLEQVEIQLKHLKKREQRVYRIFEFGGDEALLVADMASIKTERQKLLDEQKHIEAQLTTAVDFEARHQGIERFCELIKGKLSTLSFKDKRLILEALNIQVTVDGENGKVTGSIPSVTDNAQQEGCIVKPPL